jgi:cysteine synthase
MMAALGAEVVLVPQCRGSVPGQVSGADLALVEETTRKVVKERGAFRADQFRLASNFRAHYLHTAPEILAQSEYPIELFCDFVGTGGTFAGCAAAFKEANASTRCYIVEPEGAAVLSGEAVCNARHRIQGGGYSIPSLDMIRPEHVDGFVQVSDSDAITWARELARVEGIFAGYSSGANLAAAAKLLRSDFRGRTAAIIVCDSGLKYLSTDLWLPVSTQARIQ